MDEMKPCVRCGVETTNDFDGTYICTECYSVFGSCCNEMERVEQTDSSEPE